ncbi:hypothetical protein ACFQVC_19010 [Streptomyces monticola]|uniref:Uncharacterized protein n=1 Tax=Streptomyces monticola TaxID=2666263 RepID=A0ABW2JJN6_9ACTN
MNQPGPDVGADAVYGEPQLSPLGTLTLSFLPRLVLDDVWTYGPSVLST